MNIQRLTVTTNWHKIDDIVSAQVGDMFEIQNVGGYDVLACVSESEPIQTKDGFLLKPNRAGLYTKETGLYLYIKAKQDTVINIGKVTD